MRLSWHDLAREEFNEAIDYFLVHAGAEIAGNFSDAVQARLLLLQEHPAIGSPTHFGARRIPLHGFPFDIVYRAGARSTIIIAIANQSRLPRYWAGR